MSEMNQSKENRQDINERRAFWGTILLAGTILLVCLYVLYVIFSIADKTLLVYGGATITFLIIAMLTVSTVLTLRKQQELGVQLMFVSLLVETLAVGLIAEGRAFSSSVLLVMVSAVGFVWLFPQRRRNLYLLTTGITLALLWGMEWLKPSWRLSLSAPNVGPAAAAIFGILFIIYLFSQIAQGQLRAKFISAFLVITLIPLSIISFIAYNSSSTALTNDANQKLAAAASQTASLLDQFIEQNLESVRTAAQYADVINLLNTPENQRSSSPFQERVLKILTTLTRQDPVFITSVAVFDINGTDIADNNTSDIGTNKSDRSYFQETIKTGLPYASDVGFSATSGQPSIYFASPVRDANGKVLGIIRIRYAASILQKFIVANTGQAGASSYAVLLDENHVRLAHGIDRTRLYKSIVPLDATFLKNLQSQARMPSGTPQELSTNFVDFETGLKNLSKQPFFASDTNGDGALEQTATATLASKPWLVAFVQTQAVFLAPVQQQTNSNLLWAGVITLLVSVAGFFFSQTLSGPVVRLTQTAEAIAAGDINIQAKVETSDEIGKLAATFNNMTAQLRELISSLEQRVAARTKDLATVAEVGTATATILETDRLLQEVVDLTKERFNLYHSHIYLLDTTGENLVLTAGAGEPGRQMVAEGRSIPLGREQSLVARAARERKGVTVNDVTQAPDFLPNPLLPDTRSELAVPMIVGGNVIGVFDIQSDQVGRFTESDINIQTTLAAQLATSVQNVRQFEQSKARAELETLVNTIGQKIQRTATVEEALQTATREIGLALGASRVSANIQASYSAETEK